MDLTLEQVEEHLKTIEKYTPLYNYYLQVKIRLGEDASKLQALKDKICKTLKGTDLDPNAINNCCKHDMIMPIVGEAEILGVLEKHDWKSGYVISSAGIICCARGAVCEWILGEDLMGQSKETTDILSGILIDI